MQCEYLVLCFSLPYSYYVFFRRPRPDAGKYVRKSVQMFQLKSVNKCRRKSAIRLASCFSWVLFFCHPVQVPVQKCLDEPKEHCTQKTVGISLTGISSGPCWEDALCIFLISSSAGTPLVEVTSQRQSLRRTTSGMKKVFPVTRKTQAQVRVSLTWLPWLTGLAGQIWPT